MANVITIDPAKDPRWNKFVTDHRFGSIFHLSSWSEILAKTFQYDPCYIVIEKNGRIKAALPFMLVKSWITGTRLISLPRTSYCDPLVENAEELQEILRRAREILEAEKGQFFEIKCQFNDLLLMETDLKRYAHFKNQILDLEIGVEKVWKQCDRSCVRQRVQKAQKENVKVRLGETLEDMELFYDLHKKTTEKHMVPPRPFSFFRNMWDSLRIDKHLILVIAEKDGIPGGAALFLSFKKTIIFEFLGLNYDLLEYSPGHLITWEVIQMACRDGLEHFDFGLTPPGNVGLMNFKTRWGGEHRTLSYFYYPDVKGYKAFVKHSEPLASEKSDLISTFQTKAKRYAASKLYRHFG
jgi:CelD/BcsL family acetyltransferase involved in cellulose biosynthesis